MVPILVEPILVDGAMLLVGKYGLNLYGGIFKTDACKSIRADSIPKHTEGNFIFDSGIMADKVSGIDPADELCFLIMNSIPPFNSCSASERVSLCSPGSGLISP